MKGGRGARRRDDAAFLPAALEIMESPPNPLGRATLFALLALVTAAILWSFIGKVEIVAIAEGRVEPRGGLQLVQAEEVGTVRAIHVRNGDKVAAGDLLLELDATTNEIDVDDLVRRRDEARLEAESREALLRYLAAGAATFAPPELALAQRYVEAVALKLKGEIEAYDARVAAFVAQDDSARAQLARLDAENETLLALLPLVVERESAVADLVAKGHAPRANWLQLQAQLIEMRSSISVMAHRRTEAESGVAVAARERERFVAETARAAYDALAAARETEMRTEAALQRARAEGARLALRAPVSGAVHQLSARTIGGVIRPVDPVLAIVPADAPLEVRARILNKDIGVVQVGQEVVVKLAAFDFTRFGAVKGELVSVSSDAIPDEALGLVYEAAVSLAATTVRTDAGERAITPGMAASVEIKTGKRRIVDFLLSPMRRYQDEALRER